MRTFSIFLFLLDVGTGFAAPTPTPLQNYVPVEIVDGTTLNTPDKIYFLAHGLDACGLPCYLVPDNNGICQYVYPTVSGSPSSADPFISKALSDLPLVADSTYLIYLPINSSSRAYFSVENPMYLPTVFNPAPTREVLDINDSSVISPQDPNYYTWYQDFEFGLGYQDSGVATGANLLTQLFMNLSWVDYFCLPMKLEVLSYPTGEAIQGIATPVSGFDPGKSRDTIIKNIIARLNKGETPWMNLPVPYYHNQYSYSIPAGYLRILAAKNSIALSESPALFQGTYSQVNFFPFDYIHSAKYGPRFPGLPFGDDTYSKVGDDTYSKGLYIAFQSNPLDCQIFPAQGDNSINYTYTISADTTSGVLDFVYTGPTVPPGFPTPPTGISLDLETLSTEQLLSGSIWPFVVTGGTSTETFTNELSKMLSALFTIGQLPLTAALTETPPADYNCTLSPTQTTFVNNSCGFARIAPPSSTTYSYFNNPFPKAKTPNGPWYNVYDQALHEQQIIPLAGSPDQVPNNVNLGLGYGYDFDDLLNMAGLIDPIIQDQYGDPAENGEPTALPDAYIVITLGSLEGTTPLNINNDAYTTNQSAIPNYEAIPYPVAFGPLSEGTTMEVNIIWYNGSTTQTTPLSTNETIPFPNIVVDPQHPFLIQFKYNGTTYRFNINLLRQIVTPSSVNNPYSTIDQALIEGITFDLVGGETLTISVSSVAPPWPG